LTLVSRALTFSAKEVLGLALPACANLLTEEFNVLISLVGLGSTVVRTWE